MYLAFGQEMLDDLRHAQDLLGHSASSDTAAVLHRGLKALIRELEKCKFAATDRPRVHENHALATGRHIPALVQRAVWTRDGGQCTFVGDNGTRCPARRTLEFDHIEPLARGGKSTISNIRLLCRAQEQVSRVMGAMRRLGFSADESRRAATHAVEKGEASLEGQVRAALSYLVPPRKASSNVRIPLEGAPLT